MSLNEQDKKKNDRNEIGNISSSTHPEVQEKKANEMVGIVTAATWI